MPSLKKVALPSSSIRAASICDLLQSCPFDQHDCCLEHVDQLDRKWQLSSESVNDDGKRRCGCDILSHSSS